MFTKYENCNVLQFTIDSILNFFYNDGKNKLGMSILTYNNLFAEWLINEIKIVDNLA